MTTQISSESGHRHPRTLRLHRSGLLPSFQLALRPEQLYSVSSCQFPLLSSFSLTFLLVDGFFLRVGRIRTLTARISLLLLRMANDVIDLRSSPRPFQPECLFSLQPAGI